MDFIWDLRCLTLIFFTDSKLFYGNNFVFKFRRKKHTTKIKLSCRKNKHEKNQQQQIEHNMKLWIQFDVLEAFRSVTVWMLYSIDSPADLLNRTPQSKARKGQTSTSNNIFMFIPMFKIIVLMISFCHSSAVHFQCQCW